MNCINVRTSKKAGNAPLALTLLAMLILSAGAALPLQAQTESAGRQAPETTTQKWTAGWDNFSEPLNYTKSKITWSVNGTTRKITVSFSLVGAAPTKLYQFSLNFFCTTFPAQFGQFPNDNTGGGACTPLTRQGVTADSTEVEVGAVLTDVHGNGKYTIVIGPVPSGTYDLEFFVRNGAGCFVNGGAGNGDDCGADFQSPGPFGTGTTITVP